MGVLALVIQKNSWQYLCSDGTIGEMLTIPCGDDVVQIDDEMWAIPQSDEGIFTRIEFQPIDVSATAPTFDSFRVFRIRDKLNFTPYWVRGTIAQYKVACGGGAALPTDVPTVVPCQEICEIVDANNNYQAVFGISQLGAGQTYHPAGAYNNVLFTAASPAGYASIAALLVFLNANWTNVGSPAGTVTWTATADGLTLIATGDTFLAGDSICVVVNSTNTSP